MFLIYFKVVTRNRNGPLLRKKKRWTGCRRRSGLIFCLLLLLRVYLIATVFVLLLRITPSSLKNSIAGTASELLRARNCRILKLTTKKYVTKKK
jgi:hypothetical protein